jgi:spore coat protein A
MGGMALALRPSLAWAFSQSPARLRKFIQPLPGLGPDGMPVATADTRTFPGSDFYVLEAGQYQHQFHPDLAPSRVWGYADLDGKHGYLGGAIVAQRDRPVRLRMYDKLPAKHPLPIDRTIPGAGGPQNRICVHLHGGFVPWSSDGGPFAWFSPGNSHGPSFVNAGPDLGSADYYYPNQQSARLMWYHDHAMGLTRLNAYAGLATAYLLTDAFEQGLIASGVLPSIGIPLVIQDKTFVDGSDPNYTWGQVGDLWYPYLYEPERWEYAPPPGAAPLPVPSCVPEFFSDTPIVNGAAYPYLELQPRHYRFRILNGSQARFLNLQLYYADASGTEADLTRPGPKILQIGTEAGFLPAPVTLNDPPQQIGFDLGGNASRYTLLLAPAERADVLVDFSGVPAGAKLILYSDAPAPFPMGDPLNDYFSGAPGQGGGGAASTPPGLGPNTRTIMQLRIVPLAGKGDPSTLSALSKPNNRILPPVAPLDPATAARTRDLTLNESFDDYGRLIQRLGTAVQNGLDTQGLPTWGRGYMDAPTETPKAGDVEVWRIFNLTGDTHPIHFHLVNVQVLSRQPFDPGAWNGSPAFTGPPRPPDANERGWKETVRMNPGECTTVIMKFDLPSVPFAVPPSPRTGGHEYVWHCHILEHEEHDMMRPLVVQP